MEDPHGRGWQALTRARAAPRWVRTAAALAPGPLPAFRAMVLGAYRWSLPGYDSHFFVDTGGTVKVGEKAMKRRGTKTTGNCVSREAVHRVGRACVSAGCCLERSVFSLNPASGNCVCRGLCVGWGGPFVCGGPSGGSLFSLNPSTGRDRPGFNLGEHRGGGGKLSTNDKEGGIPWWSSG